MWQIICLQDIGRSCTEKETYSGADDGGKGRTETSGENPIGIIKKAA